MNLRCSTFCSALLAGTIVSMAFLPVRSVAAGSASIPALLPARFLLELPGPRALSFAPQAAPGGQKKADDSGLPDGKGKDLVQKDCTTCHAVNVFTKLHHTRDEWSSVIDEMVSKGLDAPDADLATITDYLAAHFGPSKSTDPATPDAPATPPPN
jgi:cytochrome c5